MYVILQHNPTRKTAVEQDVGGWTQRIKAGDIKVSRLMFFVELKPLKYSVVTENVLCYSFGLIICY